MKIRKYINKAGKITYKLNGQLHRLDGPAQIWPSDWPREWYVHGKRHRLDGPAREWPFLGRGEWYINDVRYYTEFEYWIAVQKYIDTHQTV